jgi:hypothetical protein
MKLKKNKEAREQTNDLLAMKNVTNKKKTRKKQYKEREKETKKKNDFFIEHSYIYNSWILHLFL